MNRHLSHAVDLLDLTVLRDVQELLGLATDELIQAGGQEALEHAVRLRQLVARLRVVLVSHHRTTAATTPQLHLWRP